MQRSLSAYNPPSYNKPDSRDYQTFVNSVRDYLQNELAQYQIPFIGGMVDVLNTGTQAFGMDLPATATLSITNWAHRITGVGVITTITPPNGFQSFIVLLSLNGFSFGAGGNISNPVAIPAGDPALAVYDPISQLWWILTDGGGSSGGALTVVTLGIAASPYSAVLSATAWTLYAVSASAGADFIFNLPTATGSGEVAIIKRMDANAHNVVVKGTASTIDGSSAPTNIGGQYASVRLADYAAGQWLGF